MSDFKAGDRVRATEDYLNEACSEEERRQAEENGGLFGDVLKIRARAVHVRWEAPGFSPDYDIAFDDEVEKVST